MQIVTRPKQLSLAMPEILAQLDPGVQRLPELVLTIGPTMLLHGQGPSQQFRLIVVKFPAIQNAEKGRREPKLRTRRQPPYQGRRRGARGTAEDRGRSAGACS